MYILFVFSVCVCLCDYIYVNTSPVIRENGGRLSLPFTLSMSSERDGIGALECHYRL